MGTVWCLSYISKDLTNGDAAEIGKILEHSRRNNRRAGVGGFLVQFNGWFFQVLEGPKEAVEALYERIAGDPRHGAVRIVLRMERETPHFQGWDMMHIRGLPRIFRTLAAECCGDHESLSLTNPCWDSPDFAERMIEAAAMVHDFSVDRQREILVQDSLP